MYTNSYDSFLNVRNGFPVFSTALEANYVRKHEDAYAAFKLTDDDKQEIHRLARDPRIGARPALPWQHPCMSGPGGLDCLGFMHYLCGPCSGLSGTLLWKRWASCSCVWHADRVPRHDSGSFWSE